MDTFVHVYKLCLNLFLNQTVNPDRMFCGPILRKSFALLSVPAHGSLLWGWMVSWLLYGTDDLVSFLQCLFILDVVYDSNYVVLNDKMI